MDWIDMDFKDFFRLRESRRELEALRLEIERSSVAQVAEALRPELTRALAELRLFHDDDDAWNRAADAVRTPQTAELRHDYLAALPSLLKLFGYEPPPKAAVVVSETTRLIAGDHDSDQILRDLTEARIALGELLRKGERIPQDPPWKLAYRATEVNAFLDLGVQVGAATVTAGIGFALGSAVGAAATAGIAPAATFIVVGGIRRFKNARKIHRASEALAAQQETLDTTSFPTAAHVVTQYLKELVRLSGAIAADDRATVDWNAMRGNLEAIQNICGRFVSGDQHASSLANQAILKGNRRPRELRDWFGRVLKLINKASAEFALYERFTPETRNELEAITSEMAARLASGEFGNLE